MRPPCDRRVRCAGLRSLAPAQEVTYAAARRNTNVAPACRLCIGNQTGGGMARGGRRAGAGRKASGKVAMLVRVSPKVRGAIEREAQRSGRSLSAQAEAMLLEAALERSRSERKSRALAYLLTQAGKVMEAAALAIATLDKARAHELAAWRNAPIGSPFYGLPQVAEDLGLG